MQDAFDWVTCLGKLPAQSGEYQPLQAPLQANLFVRTRGPSASAVPAIRAALTRVESDLAFLRVATLSEIRKESVGVLRATSRLLAIFALIGLVLASVGIYGVMAYTTRQRTAEIGTRLAMGATRGDISAVAARHAPEETPYRKHFHDVSPSSA